MKEGKNIQIIEWQDLDKKKFYGVGMIFSGLLRFTLYPANLVKTRLQVILLFKFINFHVIFYELQWN